MYSAQRYRLSEEQLAHFRELAAMVDTAPGPGGSRITPAGDVFQFAIRGVFEGTTTVRVVALYPSSQLVAHCDPPIAGTRYHIPLVVNDGCWSFSGGFWQQLEVGKVYLMDPTVIHGAVNWGSDVRLHLMVDVHA